jgi:hypothetical protein
MPKNEKNKSSQSVQSKPELFTFFRTLPTEIQQEVLDCLNIKELAGAASTSPEMHGLALVTRSDYKAILEGQRMVEEHFRGCECDFMFVPSWPEEKSLDEYLLNDVPYTAHGAYVLVVGHQIKLQAVAPDESQIQQMKNQEVFVYFEEDKFKYIVKHGVERIRGELELQLEEPMRDDDGKIWGYTISRRGIRKKYFDELNACIEKLRVGEDYSISPEALEHFFELPKERKHMLEGVNLFYVDSLKHHTSNISTPHNLKWMGNKHGNPLPQANRPKLLTQQELIEIQRMESTYPQRHDHADIKKALSQPSVLMALGKDNGPEKVKGLFTMEQALNLHSLHLLHPATSEAGFYALEQGLLTVAELITPPVSPPVPEGMVDLDPGMTSRMYRMAHRAIMEMLLSPIGLRALEKKLISVTAAHEFYNDTREADRYMPGQSFQSLLDNDGVITALEQGWLTLKSAARLSANGSLTWLLTPNGLDLLKLIYEEKDKMHPCITLNEIADFRWGYQLATLLDNSNFIPAIQERKIRFPELTEINNEQLKNKLVSPEGLEALEKNYLTVNDVRELPDDSWLSLLLSTNGMKAFEEGFTNIQSILHLIRNAKLTETSHNLYNNLEFLLNEGFYLLEERYAVFETAVEIYELKSCITPSILGALKEKLLTAEEIRHLSDGDWRLMDAVLSNDGLEKIRSDNTLIKSLIADQGTISGRSVSLLDEVAQCLDHYIEQLITIRAGMVDEYTTAQNIVHDLINNLANVSVVLSNYRLDHHYLITKMHMVHRIKESFLKIKNSLNDIYVQNAIQCDRFPSAQAVYGVIQEFDQDQLLKNHLTGLAGIKTSLEQLQTEQLNDLEQKNSGMQLTSK